MRPSRTSKETRQPTPQKGQTEVTLLSAPRLPACVSVSTIDFGISAPVGQAWTHSPQATQVDEPMGSARSKTGA